MTTSFVQPPLASTVEGERILTPDASDRADRECGLAEAGDEEERCQSTRTQ